MRTPAPPPDILHRPEVAPSWVIDTWAAGNLDEAIRIFNEFPEIMRNQRINGDTGGSWNWPPLKMAAHLVATGSRDAERNLRDYCRAQLAPHSEGGSHRGLNGRELLSRLYAPMTVCALAAAHEWARARSASGLERDLRDVLRAHAYLYALFALPHSHQEPGISLPLHITGPAMRSYANVTSGALLDYWLTRALDWKKGGASYPIPRWHSLESNWDGWPARVARRMPHTYLSFGDRELLRDHIATGKRALELVEVLTELGVTLRTPVYFERMKNGNAIGWAAWNTHSSTVPQMAERKKGGRYRALHLHPDALRGGGGRSLGQVSAKRAGKKIEAKATGASWGGLKIPRGIRVDGNTLRGSLDFPPGKPLYSIEIGPEGAVFGPRTDDSVPDPGPIVPDVGILQGVLGRIGKAATRWESLTDRDQLVARVRDVVAAGRKALEEVGEG